MKLFEDFAPEPKEVVQTIVSNKADFIKNSLLKSVKRDGEVYKLIAEWLYSFEGALSKLTFEAQIRRLDFDDDIAITQLQKAIGKRVIPLPPPPKKPPLTQSIVEQMLHTPYVGVYGKKFKPALKSAIDELKTCGKVYVLSMVELILEFKSYADKGRAPQMIDMAIDADFLFVVDLEQTIYLEWHIREAIERIGTVREQAHKPIVSTWHRFNNCNKFFERFSIFSID